MVFESQSVDRSKTVNLTTWRSGTHQTSPLYFNHFFAGMIFKKHLSCGSNTSLYKAIIRVLYRNIYCIWFKCLQKWTMCTLKLEMRMYFFREAVNDRFIFCKSGVIGIWQSTQMYNAFYLSWRKLSSKNTSGNDVMWHIRFWLFGMSDKPTGKRSYCNDYIGSIVLLVINVKFLKFVFVLNLIMVNSIENDFNKETQKYMWMTLFILMTILGFSAYLWENRKSNQEWTIQRHWQHWAQKTQQHSSKYVIILYSSSLSG